MKARLIACASLAFALALGTAMPAMALQIGTTNTVTQTVTTGHLSLSETDNHWDCGYQNVFQVSGDATLQAGLGGQIGGLTGASNFLDGDGYIGLTGAGTVSYTHSEFSDHNVTTQSFSGTQTTSSSTLSSASFVNF